jgi:hypothetical protein
MPACGATGEVILAGGGQRFATYPTTAGVDETPIAID